MAEDDEQLAIPEGPEATPATGATGPSEEGVKVEEGNENDNGVVVAGDAPAAKPVIEPPKDEITFPDVPATTLPLRLLDGGCLLLRSRSAVSVGTLCCR